MWEMSEEKLGIFIAGVLFGTVGIKLLSTKEAKKAYAHGTAAALRAKDSAMETVGVLKENAVEILAEAKQINEERAAREKEIEFNEKVGAFEA